MGHEELVKHHGYIMLVAFGFVFPVGFLIARYFRVEVPAPKYLMQ